MKIAGKILDLFTERIWTIDTSACSRGYAKLVRAVKVTRITLSTFDQNRMGFQCVALAYFVALAAIPLLAIIFAVTDGMGLSWKIPEILHSVFPNSGEVVDIIMVRCSEVLESVKKGGLGAVSAIVLLWAIIWLMFQVERVINNVWGIRKIPRKIYKRFGFYLMALILLPFIIIVFGAGIAFYSNITSLIGIDVSNVRFLPKILGYMTFYIVCAFTFSAMYTFIPATRVKYKYALKAALYTAIIFVVFQYLYLETQLFVGRLNRVYGMIAAIPLFLTWLNFSWQIIIMGAELCYGFHNVEKYTVLEWDSEHR